MKKKTLTYLIVAGLIISVLIYGVVKAQTSPGDYDEFASCLTEKGVKMYGTDWCSHCQNQKKLLGNSFKIIDYIDCDKNRAECTQEGVEGYPTWNINGENYPGEQSLNSLSALSGCELK